MKVSVILDKARDQDILEAMKGKAKGPWIREMIRKALCNETQLQEKQIIAVIDKYLTERNIDLSQSSKLLIAASDETTNQQLDRINRQRNDESNLSSTNHSDTWKMPE